MSAEAPADYVAFVDRRLPELCVRVAREVPAPGRAELLAEVLSALAGRWLLLRAATVLLRRPVLTERFLDRAVPRAGRRWRERQIYPVDLVVWETPETVAAAIRVPRVSVALRRAAVLDSTVRRESAALAEASIAWWHAYESRRRTGRIIRLTLVVLLVLIYLTTRP